MDYFTIGMAAFFASLLTFFSGFGLGTLLLPIFAIWFPVDLSVGMTAIVHLLNNLFKILLVGRHINRSVVFRFGLPAILAAFIGAALLLRLSGFEPLYAYSWEEKTFFITPIKITIAVIMIFFTLFEIIPRFKNLQIDPRHLIWGGLLSGFFGGLSGHQGALRSAFLVRTGLSKESFIATGTLIACMIDFTRISVYFHHFAFDGLSQNRLGVTAWATLMAFGGAFVGHRILKKITMTFVQTIVSGGLLLLAIALGAGLI